MNANNWEMINFLKMYASESNGGSSISADEDANTFLDTDRHPGFDENIFCTLDNLDECLQYLNNEICILGFPSIYTNDGNCMAKKRVNFDLTKLINCMYELIKRHQRQVRLKDDMQERQYRCDNDNDILLQTQERLKQELENTRREIALSGIREKDTLKKCSCLQQDLKICKEEKRKMKMDLDHLRKQYLHESKRLEKEVCRLRERVNQLLGNKVCKEKIAIDMSNPLTRSDGKRGRWKTAGKRNNEEMFRLVIRELEDKEKILLMENNSLRESICEIHCDLSTGNPNVPRPSEENREKKDFQMPYYLVKEDIGKKIKSMINSLRNNSKVEYKFDKTDACTVSNEDTLPPINLRIEELTNQLKEYKLIIANNEKMIQDIDNGKGAEAYEKLLSAFGLIEGENSRYEERKHLFREELKKFGETQKRFFEYVSKVEKEKQEFETERAEFYSYCLTTPLIKRDLKMQSVGSYSGSNHQSCPSTPRLSRSPPPKSSNHQKIPSTGELYKYFSLSYDNEAQNKPSGSPTHDESFVFTSSKSPTYDGSFVFSSPMSSSEKVREHSDKIRKAVEDRQNKYSSDGISAKLF